ncbi:MAG: DUF6616 family protein [Thermomicrobiales bacterium]
MSERLGWVNFSRPRDDWYYLSPADRERLLDTWQQIHAAAEAAGAQRFGVYEVRASTRWARLAVWEFPDLRVLTGMVDALSDAEYYRYFAEENAFGREIDDPFANYMIAADQTASLLEDQGGAYLGD